MPITARLPDGTERTLSGRAAAIVAEVVKRERAINTTKANGAFVFFFNLTSESVAGCHFEPARIQLDNRSDSVHTKS